jgi:uncharacterized membrane protein
MMQIILGLFPNAARAQAAVQALSANHTMLQAANIGIVSKDPDGHIDFLETTEERELRHLSTLGRLTGWLLGLVGAVEGAPFTIWQSATAGDLVDAEVAIRHGAGFPDQALRHLGKHLHAGGAVVVILTRREASGPVMAALEQCGGTVYQGALPPEVEAELATGPAANRT